MNQDNAGDGDEIERIDTGVASLHPKTGNKESNCNTMHYQSVKLVDDHSIALGPIHNLVLSKA